MTTIKPGNYWSNHLKPEGEQTEVIWSMSGHKDFITKIMCMFMSMDEMIGSDFEKGLAQMKAVVEK